MNYSRLGDRVTVEFSTAEFLELLAYLTYAHNRALGQHDEEASSYIGDFIERVYRASQDDLALYALLPPDRDSVP